MRVTITMCAALAALALCETAHAEVVDLKTLEKRAVERHFSLRAADARTRAAGAGVDEARSAYKPRIGLNIDSNLAPGRNLVQLPGSSAGHYTYVQGVNVAGSGASSSAMLPQWRSTAQLTVGTTIYDFGRTAASVAASGAKLSSAKADEELTRAQVIAGVRQAYLGWLSAHELHRLSSTGAQDSTQRTTRVNALIQEGARPRGDFAPVESDRLLSELELERASGDLDNARMALEGTVGEPLSSSAEPDLAVLDVQYAPEAADKIDPSLRMLAFQRAATEATARLQRKANAPSITAQAGGGIGVQLNTAGGSAKKLPTYLVGLGISFPLWDGGGSHASAAATDARADELRIRLEDEEVNRHQERAKARLDAEHAAKREATALMLVDICKTRVADTEAGYELGAMQFDQVQQARAMLRRAETEVVLAKVARAEAVLRFAP